MTQTIAMHCPDCERMLPEGVIECPYCPPKQKPAASLAHFVVTGLALAMAILFVTVIYHTKLDEPVKPPDDPRTRPVIPRPGEDIEAAERRERKLNEPIVLSPAAERNLLRIFARILKHHYAILTAAENLKLIRERVAKLDTKIEEDVTRNGPLADIEFRQRWNYVTSPERNATQPAIPEFDKALSSDLVERRSISRRRIVTLIEGIQNLRTSATPRMAQERSLFEFCRSIPYPGVSLLMRSEEDRLKDARERLVDEEVLKRALMQVGNTLYLRHNGPGSSANDSVDCVDALLILLLERGIIKCSYQIAGLKSDDALNELQQAESALQTYLDESRPGGPEVNTFDSAPPVAPTFETSKTSKVQVAPEDQAEEATKRTVREVPIVPPTPPQPPIVDPVESPFPGDFRRWTDIRGKSCMARVVELSGDYVWIENYEGERRKFLIVNFSITDREYLMPYRRTRSKLTP